MKTTAKPGPKVVTPESLPDLRKRTLRILNTAERTGDSKTALMAVGVLAKLAESEVIREVEFMKGPGWKRIENAIFTALEPFPETKKALSTALVGITKGTFLRPELLDIPNGELEFRISEYLEELRETMDQNGETRIKR